MILAAGFGTRLRPLTQVLPKPMFPLLNRPLLSHSIQTLRSANIREIAVNIHHLAETIIGHFGDGASHGVKLHFSKEEKILGTAGGIKALEGFLNGGPFFVINSDIVADIDLNRVVEFHKRKASCLTLVAREDISPEQYDPIEIDEDGRVVHFVGASSMNLPDSTRRVMFTGIQIMEPEIFSRIPTGIFCGTTEDIFPQMVGEGLPVYGFLHEGYWIDMGNRQNYIQVHEDALDGKFHLKKGPSHVPDGPFIIPPVHIGKDCSIAKDVQIGPYAVLGNGCTVKHGAIIEHSVLWEKVTAGAGAVIKNSVIAEKATVPDGSEIDGQSLIPA